MRPVIATAFGTLVLLGVAQAFWQHGRLPETVAAHFNHLGQPDRWTSREVMTAWHVGTMLFVGGMLEGVARLIRHTADSLINLPRRDYWLAPERRANTVAALATMIRLIGCVVVAFLLGVFHQVYRANTGSGELTSAAVLLVGGLLVSLGLIIATSLFRFARPPA